MPAPLRVPGTPTHAARLLPDCWSDCSPLPAALLQVRAALPQLLEQGLLSKERAASVQRHEKRLQVHRTPCCRVAHVCMRNQKQRPRQELDSEALLA